MSSCSGEGDSGAGGIRRALTGPSKCTQSALSHMGRGGARSSVGAARWMRIGPWSDPVEGRVVESQDRKAGRMSGLAKARSMTLGLKEPKRGNLMYTPGVLRRE